MATTQTVTSDSGPLAGYRVLELGPAGDNQYIHITAASDAVFKRIASAIGEPALAADVRVKTALVRAENEDAIDAIITRWTLKHTCAEAEQKLHAAEVPAARIYTMADIFKDPHYAARNMLAQVPDDDFGTVTVPNVVPKLSATPGAIRHSGHRIGQDTRRVLTEPAGLSATEIAQLEAQRVIACDRSGDGARSVEASEAS